MWRQLATQTITKETTKKMGIGAKKERNNNGTVRKLRIRRGRPCVSAMIDKSNWSPRCSLLVAFVSLPAAVQQC